MSPELWGSRGILCSPQCYGGELGYWWDDGGILVGGEGGGMIFGVNRYLFGNH